MMQVLTWEGKVASCNQRLTPRKGGGLMNTAVYRIFRDELAYTFRAQRQRTFTTPDVMIYVSIGTRMDHHNLIKPVLDALQIAGVIDNDKYVGWLTMAPAERHGDGKRDLIFVFIRGT